MDSISIVKRAATVDEFMEMRKSIGWGCRDREVLVVALANSLFSVCAVKRDEIVGFGRLIGDSGFTFYVQDVMVKPAYQGQGIGKKIVSEIVEFVRENYNDCSMLCLMAAKGKEPFYRQFGFIERPNETYGAGMIQYIYK